MPTSTPPQPERPAPIPDRTRPRSLPFDRLVILLLGACGCILSFDSLRQVALATHVRPDLSYLFPVVIDGFIAYGVRAILLLRDAPRSARLYAWTLFGAATAASLWANSLHSVRLNSPGTHVLVLGNHTVAVLSTIAPMALGGATHLHILVTSTDPVPDSTHTSPDNRNSPPCGGASCPGMSHSGVQPAPGVAGSSDAVARGRSATATLGPGVPSGTYDDAVRTESDLPDAPTSTVAHAVAQHHRRRLGVPRRHRVNPCFSDAEWSEITEAAGQCGLMPGGFTAAATVAYSRTERRTSIDEERRGLENLINANNDLAAIGGRLNGFAHHLNSGGTPNAEPAGLLLEHVSYAVQRADTAVLAVPHAESAPPNRSRAANPSPAAEITRHHRLRMTAPRRNRTHPCFSDSEWADLIAAARVCHLKPGGYAAVAALLAARTADPRAAIADTRRQLEELMESNRQFAAIGNNLNQVLAHLRPSDALYALAQRTLRLIHMALDDVDTAALQIAWR